MMLSDVCLSVSYIGPKSRTERHRKTKIDTDVAHVRRNSGTNFKVKRSKGHGHRAALVGCPGRPTWTYSNGDLSICVHDIYRVIACRPGRGHIVAAARLQLVVIFFRSSLEAGSPTPKGLPQSRTFGSRRCEICRMPLLPPDPTDIVRALTGHNGCTMMKQRSSDVTSCHVDVERARARHNKTGL